MQDTIARAHGFKNLKRQAAVAPDQRIEVTLSLRRENQSEFTAQLNRIMAGEVSPMTRAALEKRYGASEADLKTVADFAEKAGLVVVESAQGRRSMVLSGKVTDFQSAFNVKLYHYSHDAGTFRGFDSTLAVPSGILGPVTAVLGLANPPQARTHFRVASRAAVSYTPLQVAARYQLPAGTGHGQSIGIIELGGGFAPADLATYFAALGVATPAVTAISVDGATNSPTGSTNGPDGEVMLDIEVAGSLAPAATIAVYFAPNTDAGFLNAISTAVHDTVEHPDVISISWGGPESSWAASAMQAMDAAIADAVAVGITVCIASGDNGASDGVSGGLHVDFPASSPHALACGGTSLSPTAESVWNDGTGGGATGGGVSQVFARPSYQNGLGATPLKGQATPLPMRGVPDVSGDADPETGYQVRVDGSDLVIGGTSAVAPLWAGIIARLNSINGTGPVFVAPMLYASPQSCNDITKGNNEGYAASTGWDACTGLGSPNGPALQKIISQAKPKPKPTHR
jgi:kumamolisin